MRWAEHIVHMEEMRNTYSILVGKPEGEKPLKYTYAQIGR
jgi:hypothetical protein